jgi:tetratricopeptide (TPR) repeat protein
MAKFYYTYYALKDYPTAYELIKQAESLRPSDIRLLEIKTWIQRRLGVFEERIETIRKLIELDPLNTGRPVVLVWNLVATHQYDAAQAEIDATDGESYGLAAWKSLLDLRHDRDIGRWFAETQTLHERYEEDDPLYLWEAHIAARDFAGAERLTESLDTESSDIGVYMSEQDIRRIITAWFQGNEELLAEMLPAGRTFLEQSRGADGEFINHGTNLELALIAAVEGKTTEVERLVRKVLQEARKDMTAQIALLNNACQVLSMAGAASAAVDCLRRGFAEPSNVHPFLEPYLPYYDPIREDPVFIELLAEIE